MTRARSAAAALLFTYLAARAFWWVSGQPWRLLDDASAEGIVKSLVWVIPAVLILIAARRLSLHEAWRELGLDSSAARGYAFGFLATMPMVLALPLGPAYAIDPTVLVGTVLLGPLAEEVLFRGFLFKQLLTRARWPLAWSIGVSAVVFALAHFRDLDQELLGQLALVQVPAAEREFVRQSLGLESLSAIDFLLRVGSTILVLAPGGALFAWVFHRFGSLWPAIGLHACLNLWWMVSHGSDARGVFTLDASGIAQVVALGLAFLLTLRKPRTLGEAAIDGSRYGPPDLKVRRSTGELQ
jgi:membrane protease YdiL (CAAX protease family)